MCPKYDEPREKSTNSLYVIAPLFIHQSISFSTLFQIWVNNFSNLKIMGQLEETK